MLSLIGLIIYLLFILAGLLLVPLSLPGLWVIVGASVVYSLFADFQPSTSDLWVLFVLVILATLGELLEFGISVLGSKKMKVSNGAIVCSIVGGIVGAIIGAPIILIGSLIGLIVGVFLGAFAYEMVVKKDFVVALEASVATSFSRVTAMFVKTMIAFVMVVYLLVKMFL